MGRVEGEAIGSEGRRGGRPSDGGREMASGEDDERAGPFAGNGPADD